MFFLSKLRSLSPLVVFTLLFGCSDGDPPADADPCNQLVNDGPILTPELVSAGTTPLGGTIVDGRYAQTAMDRYPDAGQTLEPDERVLSGVFDFVAGSLESVIDTAQGGADATERTSATYFATDADLSVRYSCPDQGTIEHLPFTATATEIRLFARVTDNQGTPRGTAELVLTKR